MQDTALLKHLVPRADRLQCNNNMFVCAYVFVLSDLKRHQLLSSPACVLFLCWWM